MCTESVLLSNYLILCHPLLLLPSIFPSIRVFSNESALPIRWPKCWENQLQHQCLPMNIQSWFPLGLTGLISLQSKGLSRVFSNTTIQTYQFFSAQPSLCSNSHKHSFRKTGKTRVLTIQNLSAVKSLLFSILSRSVIAFLPRSKHLLISWLQSLSTVILKTKKISSVTASTFSPYICHEVMGLDAVIFVFWKLSFKQAFSLSSFTLIKRLFSSYSLSAIRVVPSANLRLLIFLLAILIPAWSSSSLAFHMMCSA